MRFVGWGIAVCALTVLLWICIDTDVRRSEGFRLVVRALSVGVAPVGSWNAVELRLRHNVLAPGPSMNRARSDGQSAYECD